MRVTSSLPVLATASDAVPNRSTAAPTGDRFRAALRVAGKTDHAGDRADDITASAATQAAYLARAAGLTGMPQNSDPGKPNGAAGVTRAIGSVSAAAPVRATRASAAEPVGSAASAGAIEPDIAGTGATIADLIAADPAAGVPGTGIPRTSTGGTGNGSAATEPTSPADDVTTRDVHTQLGLLIDGVFGGAIAISTPPPDGAVPPQRISHPAAGVRHPPDPAGGDPAMISMLRAAYGIATDTTAGAAVQPPIADVSCVDSPVAAWRAAAVSRAIGLFGGATGTPRATPDAAAVASHANAEGPAATAASTILSGLASAGLAATALTPLEQAVHDLVDRLTEREPGHDHAGKPPGDGAVPGPLPLPGPAAPPSTSTRDATSAAPIHAAASPRLPEPPANPSHVHLVIEDGPERVVATVAIRGSEVHVSLRATDDATAAALARNAGSLDHAMRSRGLDLGELTAEREPRDQRPSQDTEPRERRARDTKRFDLEEES